MKKQDELQFYEKYLLKEADSVQRKFFEEHPDFLNGYSLNPLKVGKMELLKDKTFRGIMRKVRAYEE